MVQYVLMGLKKIAVTRHFFTTRKADLSVVVAPPWGKESLEGGTEGSSELYGGKVVLQVAPEVCPKRKFVCNGRKFRSLERSKL